MVTSKIDKSGAHRVCMVVRNSVSHDSRVIKEGESLSRAGYDVTIVGIRDGRDSRPQNMLPDGTRIVRIPRADQCLLRIQVFAALFAVGVFQVLLLASGGLFLLALAGALPAALDGIPGVSPWPLGVVAAASLLALCLSGIFLLKKYAWYTFVVNTTAPVPGASATSGKATAARAAAPRPKPEPSTLNKISASPGARPLESRRPGCLTRLLDALHQTANTLARPVLLPLADAYYTRELLKAVLSQRPDVVHCHDLNTLTVGVRAKERIGCLLVYDSHEVYEELSLLSPSLRRKACRQQHRQGAQVDGFITVNDSIGEYLCDKYDLPDATVVMNATMSDNLCRDDYDGRLHRAAGLPDDTRILLYQGGFAKFRGLDVLVRAGALLPSGWALVMMGWGNYEPTLRALASEVDPEGTRIRFIPAAPREELPQWTCGATVGAIPYENVCLNHWYCSPNKLWEYPNAGVPILASPFPELRKVVESEDVGWLLDEPATPEGIAAVISGLNEEALTHCRANCCGFIQRSNWTVFERRLVAMYDSLGKPGRESA